MVARLRFDTLRTIPLHRLPVFNNTSFDLVFRFRLRMRLAGAKRFSHSGVHTTSEQRYEKNILYAHSYGLWAAHN